MVLVTTALWYFIKNVLHRNGYATHLFWGHFSDIINLHSLVNKTHNTEQKRNYILLLIAFYIAFVLTIASFVLMAFSS